MTTPSKAYDSCVSNGLSLPLEICNEPGLVSIKYRIGTHARFKRDLLTNLRHRSEGRSIGTSENDDFTVGLVDAWSAVADILTFYQERIANESYLRTAKERFSIQMLARSIGYGLSAGVAAKAYFSFKVKDANKSGRPIRVPERSKVQSIPDDQERPQTFETIVSIDARPEWNEIALSKGFIEVPMMGSDTIVLRGTSLDLKVGETLVFVGDEREEQIGAESWDVRTIAKIEPDNERKTTLVTLDKGLGLLRNGRQESPAKKNVKVLVFRKRASLFGHNAPDWKTMPKDFKIEYKKDYSTEKNENDVQAAKDGKEWPGLNIESIVKKAGLTDKTGITSVFHESSSDVIGMRKPASMMTGGNKVEGYLVVEPSMANINTASIWPRTTYYFKTAQKNITLKIDGEKVIERPARNTIAAHTMDPALRKRAYREEEHTIDLLPGSHKVEIEAENPKEVLFRESGKEKVDSLVTELENEREKRWLVLDSIYPAMTPGSWILLSARGAKELFKVIKTVQTSVTDFAISGKTTALLIEGENFHLFKGQVRETVVFGQHEVLPLGPTPYGIVENCQLILDTPYPDLRKGMIIAISDIGPDGLRFGEVAKITENLIPYLSGSMLKVDKLERDYSYRSAFVNANVALATHGETVQEILGSGDSSIANQKFLLKQGPLTYIAVPGETGSCSTLEVQVNDDIWNEVPNLYLFKSTDKVFIIKIQEDGKAIVEFGDGEHGSRLPNGDNNIRAKYRKGIGGEGLLRGGQLSNLLTRGLGMEGVTNVAPPIDAQDPEPRDMARRNAPSKIVTFGRVVSLLDYEDFSRTYAGVVKANATWIHKDEGRGVLVTVAGEGGRRFASGSTVIDDLKASLVDLGNPEIRTVVREFTAKHLKVSLDIEVEPGIVPESVASNVKNVLFERYQFASRSFGQDVSKGEVIENAANISGVRSAILTRLECIRYENNQGTGHRMIGGERLTADVPRSGAWKTPAAELLYLNEMADLEVCIR